MRRAEFAGRFGSPDLADALCGYTREADTHVVLMLLACARPRRVLAVGTALEHMTANFTRWTLDDAQIFSLGIVQGIETASPGAREQQFEHPTRVDFARFADHFGKARMVFFMTADSMLYDFGGLAPLEFENRDIADCPGGRGKLGPAIRGIADFRGVRGKVYQRHLASPIRLGANAPQTAVDPCAFFPNPRSFFQPVLVFGEPHDGYEFAAESRTPDRHVHVRSGRAVDPD